MRERERVSCKKKTFLWTETTETETGCDILCRDFVHILKEEEE